MNKAIFTDLDGTVRTTKGGKPCPNKPSDQEIMPGRIAKLLDYKKRGYKIVAVTNQGGIGLGYMTEGQCQLILDDLDRRMGGIFDKMLYAKAAPTAGHQWTKPNPGMILAAAKDLDIDLKESIMVGDMDTDQMAAQRAGVTFRWAKDFF
jgi:D-glycero-D-manno-heptose 1,7-bisphosphate phosphatase